MNQFETIVDFLIYLSKAWFNYGLGSNWSLIWNYPPDPAWSYFEIKDIELNKLIVEQREKVLIELENLFEKYKTMGIF